MKNKMTLLEFKEHVKKEAEKLFKIEILKEEKNKIEQELSILNEGQTIEEVINSIDPVDLKKIRQELLKKAAGWATSEQVEMLSEKKYSDKASNFIGKEISHLEKDKDYEHDRAVAAAINIAKDKGYKVPAKTNEAENSSPLGTKENINEWPEDVKKGRFTTYCKKNGHPGGASIECAKHAMDSDDASVRGMATFYMNTVKPEGKTASALEEEDKLKLVFSGF